MTTRSHGVSTRANFQRTDAVSWVGSSCGRHGSYIFYKAFRFVPFKPPRPATSGSSVAVRSRTRERRNTLSDSDVGRTNGEKCDDVLDPTTDVEERILCLGEFFFVQCRPEDPVCIGELQLLWHDKHSGQDLSSTRLYYLPETTPAGRTPQHGQDEVLAVSEKVVMRTSDLSSWVVEPEEWIYGTTLPVYKSTPLTSLTNPISTSMQRYSLMKTCVNMADVRLEKQLLMAEGFCPEHKTYAKNLITPKSDQPQRDANSHVPARNITLNAEEKLLSSHCTSCGQRPFKAQILVLSLTAYCRHKAVMKRLEMGRSDWLSRPEANQLLASFGAYTTDNPKLRLVFCRDTFDYSQLFEHDLICEEFAPVFKGRPRKKTKKSTNYVSHKNNKKSDERNSVPSAENIENCSDKVEDESARANRRRSKRKLQQRSSDDESLVSTLHRFKRARRAPPRTLTPLCTPSAEKESSRSGSKSEPSSPTEPTEEDPAESNGRRRSKRRPRPRPSDLSIALRNSLLENHKTRLREAKKQRSRSTASSSTSGSSRSSTPTDGLNSNEANKTPSPTGSSSSASSAPSGTTYAQPSPESPLDFSAVPPPERVPKKELDLTSETNMYLRGLSEGHLPENKSEFLDVLYQFMRKRNTPIGRIPSLGFKKLDLWTFFKLSQEYGGYDMVTAKRLWKHVYDRMGGNPSCTSAATCTRKHFEKLLLPLEVYLRQACLRNKDGDAKPKSDDTISKTDPPTTVSALNGKTFDGDVYFTHSAKLANSPDGQANDDATGFTSPSVTKSLSDVSVTSSTAGISLMKNGFNFDSLVHNVINSEILPEHDKSLKGESTPNSDKLKKLSGSSDASIELIDLTESGAKSPTTSHLATTADSKPLTSCLPSKPSIFTRTHCPRISNVPPPFVPKAPPQKIDPAEKNRNVHGFVELSRIQSDNVRHDVSNLKRSVHHTISPPSPKRTRDPSPRNHAFNNVATTDKSQAHNRIDDRSLFQKQSFHDDQRAVFKTELLPNKRPEFNSRIQSHHSSGALTTKVPAPDHLNHRALSESHRLLPKYSTLSSDISRRLPIGPESKASMLHRKEDRNQQKERSTYYRPASMLASHRQQQAKCAAASSNGVKEDRQTDEKLIVAANLLRSRNETIKTKESNQLLSDLSRRSPAAPPQPPLKQEPTPRSSFSSSFSVDRLTSDNQRSASKPSPSNLPVKITETRPPHLLPAVSSRASIPTFVDPRQVPYRTPSERETYRSSGGAHLPSRSEPRTDQRWSTNTQSNAKRLIPSNIASSSSPARTCQVMLESLPQPIASIIQTQMPRDCSPKQLEAIIRDTLLKLYPLTAENAFPQTVPGLSVPGRVPVLSEALLRPENMLLRAQQDLAQAALLGNSSGAHLSTTDQLSLLHSMQMYRTLAYAQQLAESSALLHPGRSPLTAAAAVGHLLPPARASPKPPIHGDIVNQNMRLRAPISLPQAPVLVANPQRPPLSNPDMATFPYTRR